MLSNKLFTTCGRLLVPSNTRHFGPFLKSSLFSSFSSTTSSPTINVHHNNNKINNKNNNKDNNKDNYRTSYNYKTSYNSKLRYFGFLPLMLGVVSVAVCEERTTPSEALPTFVFETGVSVIPDPAKAHKGGEDAYFISDDHKVLGVADGVGGWAKHGVDPALYSRALMEGAKAACNDEKIAKDPVKLMQKGYEAATEILGSSTCCIVLMDDGILRTANLGDSGFMVVREDSIVFRSKEQQHSFNFPFQLGGKTSKSKDIPQHSNVDNIQVQAGDIVILGSDGLWDNLYDSQILQLMKRTHEPTKLAPLIASTASDYAHRRTGRSPFADGMFKATGKVREGGKVDDITVVVGRVRARDIGSTDEDDSIIAGVLGRFWAKL